MTRTTPTKNKKDLTVSKSFTIPASLMERLEVYKEESGQRLSLSFYVTQAIEDFLDKEEKKTKATKRS